MNKYNPIDDVQSPVALPMLRPEVEKLWFASQFYLA